MNIEIANRLVELRRAHGYSQEELAAVIGVSRQAVSKWERGESSPDTDNLIALARLYRISLDDLLMPAQAAGAGAAACAAEPAPQEDEDARIFAAAAAWDAADEAAAQRRRDRLKRALNRFPYPVAVTILYLALGFLFSWWSPGWLLFLTIPIYYGVVSAL